LSADQRKTGPVSVTNRRRSSLAHPVGRHPPASPTSDLRLFRVGPAARLRPGESMKFILPVHGIDEECFVINFHGKFHAYINQCRHVPMAMDWVDNQFFAEHGRYLMCQTHSAYYEPGTGECIAGPSDTCGKFLYRVPLTIKRGVIYATPPDHAYEDD
jgi:nitrite reductase/ring-hydroxylating ferredoxin subunit